MYWIAETATSEKNSSAWKGFQCDYLTDISDMPTDKKEGVPQPNDTVVHKKCSLSSECLCLEDSSVWILGSNGWKQI